MLQLLEERRLLSASILNTNAGTGAVVAPEAHSSAWEGDYPRAVVTAGSTVSAAPLDLSQTFQLHSNASANYRIYLDFNGHTTAGTFWNSNFASNQSIVSPAFDPDGNGSSFTDNEKALIQRIWQSVAEDFLPFNVDVTTEAPPTSDLIKSGGGDSRWGIRVVITGDQSWYPNNVGGVAYLGSFQWDTDTPAFVFNTSEVSAREAITHEVGHALGLEHDGTSKLEYFGGYGTGPTSWGPIMGASYSPNVVQWSKGEYPDASNKEDDLAIITDPSLNGGGSGYSGLSYRDDDFGSSIITSHTLNLVNGVTSNGEGIIERNTDLDFYRITTFGGQLDLQLTPNEVSPNLDIELKLYDSLGNLIHTSSPTGDLSASLSLELAAGIYYFSIDGVGEPGLYSDYGSLGRYRYSVTTTALDPNDRPTDILLSNRFINENSSTWTNIGQFSAIDPDLVDVFSYTLMSVDGVENEGLFLIVGNQLKAVRSFDFESKSSYVLRVRVTDRGGLTFEKSFTIAVRNVNESPTQLYLNYTTPGGFAENLPVGQPVGFFTTVDPDAGGSHSYTLVGGAGSADNSQFRIVGNQLQSNRVFDFETKNVYSIRVRVTDQGGLFYERTIPIFIKNVNERPTQIYLTYTTPGGFAENLAVGQPVGFFTAVDPDAGGSHFYSLVGGEGGAGNSQFRIVGNQLQSNTVFDFETKNVYSIRVRVTDQGGLSHDRVFSIFIKDVNDRPSQLYFTYTTAGGFAENLPVGQPVGFFTKVDQDAGGSHSYTLVGGQGSQDNSQFRIVGNQLRSNVVFDFERKSSYSIRVRVTDQGGLVFERSFTIFIKNVAD